MKVELQISETYEEEKLIVQAPQPTDTVQKVIEFAENLDPQETVNTDSISHLKLTPNGLVEIFLKNESFTYSSRRYLKTIKEKLEL